MAFLFYLHITASLMLSIIITIYPLKLADSTPISETSLSNLFTDIEACDLELVHSGRHEVNFLSIQLTIVFNTKTLLIPEKIFDVHQVRMPHCRIILILFRLWNSLNPFEWLNDRFEPKEASFAIISLFSRLHQLTRSILA